METMRRALFHYICQMRIFCDLFKYPQLDSSYDYRCAIALALAALTNSLSINLPSPGLLWTI